MPVIPSLCYVRQQAVGDKRHEEYRVECKRDNCRPYGANAMGYGSKVATSLLVNFMGRWWRVYVCIWSNSGWNFIVVKGQRLSVEAFA